MLRTILAAATSLFLFSPAYADTAPVVNVKSGSFGEIFYSTDHKDQLEVFVSDPAFWNVAIAPSEGTRGTILLNPYDGASCTDVLVFTPGSKQKHRVCRTK